jgi:exodeoxyribonuclease-3
LRRFVENGECCIVRCSAKPTVDYSDRADRRLPVGGSQFMTISVVSWNVENALRCMRELPGIAGEFGTPDVVCLQELRIRAQDDASVRALEHALPGYRCHYALPRDPRNVTFRGGRMYGVATFVRGRWRAEVPAWDLEGRIVVVRRARLAIVNVYAVNGTAKAWFDEAGRVAGDRHQFKRRFQASVMDLGRALRRHAGVVMVGDWNVSRTALDTWPRLRTEQPHSLARAELNARMLADGFTDIWRERHRNERAYTWFNRRSRSLDAARVDYILVSEDLAARVVAADILERLPWSDHTPVRVEFE